LLPRDSSPHDAANESRNKSNDTLQGRTVEDKSYGRSSRIVWRRKETAAQGSEPRAPVEEVEPLDPAARLTNTTMIPNSTPVTQQPAAHNMDGATGEEAAQQINPCKVVLAVLDKLLANLRSRCHSKASVSLIGRIQGKHPGLQALTAWARENLHSSLSLLSILANNVFEVTFEQPEGRIYALNQADLMCESATIFFSSWRPHFDASTSLDRETLDYPVWMQVVNLCQILRDEEFLRTIGDQIGQVISIDNSETYRAKLFGPRIRLLVRDLDNLPHTAVLPRLDGEGTIEYALEFSGLPNQCGRCRSRDHQVRFCPKKEFTSRHQHRFNRRQGHPHRPDIFHSPVRRQDPAATGARTPPRTPEEQNPSATPRQQQQETNQQEEGSHHLHTQESI
jgi:hypothetical protein